MLSISPAESSASPRHRCHEVPQARHLPHPLSTSPRQPPPADAERVTVALQYTLKARLVPFPAYFRRHCCELLPHLRHLDVCLLPQFVAKMRRLCPRPKLAAALRALLDAFRHTQAMIRTGGAINSLTLVLQNGL